MTEGRLPTVMLIFGTRPEAVKMAPLVRGLRAASWCRTVVTVTAQHREMLDQVLHLFEIESDHDLDLLAPGQTLTDVTVRALRDLGPVLDAELPDVVVVQGDTTTTFVGALAAFYRQIPVVHMEAGLRTGDPYSPFPEEINRRLVSQLATVHLAATPLNRENLVREGVNPERIAVTGNTVIDALSTAVGTDGDYGDPQLDHLLPTADADRQVVLFTAHRRESWGEPMRELGRAIAVLALAFPAVDFVFPIHRNPIVRNDVLPSLQGLANVVVTEPLPYGAFCRLMGRSTIVVTDSGGIQEEAPGLGKPVLVIRDTTERPEAVSAGTARLIGTTSTQIVKSVTELLTDALAYGHMANAVNPYGDGRATERTVAAIGALLGRTERLADFAP